MSCGMTTATIEKIERLSTLLNQTVLLAQEIDASLQRWDEHYDAAVADSDAKQSEIDRLRDEREPLAETLKAVQLELRQRNADNAALRKHNEELDRAANLATNKAASRADEINDLKKKLEDFASGLSGSSKYEEAS